jgi:signal transduction histidine kinase
MSLRRASFRLWLLVALLVVGALGVVTARMAIARIQAGQEHAVDEAKDTQIAGAIADQLRAGAGRSRLTAIQSALPYDQLLVYRHGRLIFTGPSVPSTFELQATTPFPDGLVVINDYHSPTEGASFQLTLILAGWGLFIAAVALAAAWLLGKAVQAPIDRAVAAADRVAAGDLGARIGTEGTDEFAGLAGAFDSMAERLESVDRDQRQFLADVAHEIATPVNSISGLGTALADGTLASAEERADALVLIETETRRMRELLDDLRQLTRLDLAEPVRSEEVDVGELLRDIEARFAAAAEHVGVKLSVHGSHETITVDRRLLETAVDNFVSNAIRYTPAGGSVTVTTTRTGDSLALSVADTGIGIDKENLGRVFDRFYRVDQARDRASGGSGLGLPLAKRAAQSLGARLEVSSELGLGSEFTIVLSCLGDAPKARIV